MRSPYVALVFLAAFALRVCPAILSEMPFSTDAWSPIRNTMALLDNTPIPLGDDDVFDGYNNYWPANSLFGAVFTQIVGLSPLSSMSLAVPLAGALAIPIFYALASRLLGDSRRALAASILLSLAYPYALFTSGVTKETYAAPLLMLLLFVFLACSLNLKSLLIFSLSSIALVASHHLTSAVAAAVMAASALAASIERFRRGLGADQAKTAFTVAFALAAAAYLAAYAGRGLRLQLTFNDLLSVASYQAVAFAFTLHASSNTRRSSNARKIAVCFISTLLVLASAIACTATAITPSAPVLPRHYLLYAAHFALLSPLAASGFYA
ncbi:MAG: hypothetical protein QXW94_06595, partial [Desulfurococcaceae archaeon]